MKAPLFSLFDQNNKLHTLSDYAGKWVVLYVYPKDDTPGCTIEACSFRDSITEFNNRDIIVLGISKDSIKSHTKFALKHSLNFPLLSDPDKETIKAYGALATKSMFGNTFLGVKRKTFLISPEQEIVKEYENMNLSNHVNEILKDILELKK